MFEYCLFGSYLSPLPLILSPLPSHPIKNYFICILYLVPTTVTSSFMYAIFVMHLKFWVEFPRINKYQEFCMLFNNYTKMKVKNRNIKKKYWIKFLTDVDSLSRYIFFISLSLLCMMIEMFENIFLSCCLSTGLMRCRDFSGLSNVWL